jgi:hypothetical protein
MMQLDNTKDVEDVASQLVIKEEVEVGGWLVTGLKDDKELEKLVSEADRRLRFVDSMRDLIAKRTKVNDWLNQNGNPYLTEAGLSRFRAAFGIYEKDVTSYTIDAEGNKKSISEVNVFSGDIRFIMFTGIVGSKLLGVDYSYEGGSRLEDGFKNKDDILFYMQKAKANWNGRALRKLLGMENFSWEELEKYGIKKDMVRTIERISTQKVDTEKAKELHNLLLELNEGDVKKAEDYLESLTKSDKYAGKRRASQLSEAQINWILPKIKNELNKKFPDKKVDKSVDDVVSGNASEQKFLDTVKLLVEDIKEEDFLSFLYENNINDWTKLTGQPRNKFIIELKKYVAERKK